jgi:hypothetical protein
LGDELDATLTYAYSSNVTIQGGLSVILQDDAWADIGGLTENMTWTYVMISATF